MIQQDQLILSPYMKLYDLIISKDNILKQLKDLVDFTFIDDFLVEYYTLDNGRPAYQPQLLFKYLFLKRLYDLSDRDVVERAKTDLSFKYFLGIAPEDDVINPSTLTKFRKLRMKDEKIMDLLISKSVQIARENGIKFSNSIIVDSTHTEARYNAKSAREYLLEVAKNLRKKVYDADETYVEKMPKKPDNNQIGLYEEVVKYCKQIIDLVSNDKDLIVKQNIQENLNLLEETVNDITEELEISKDQDAKIGHKTCDSNFFGYKTHLALTPERIIVGATVTSGEKHDGKELPSLICKSEQNGISVENIIGDGAYSESENIKYAKEKNLNLVSRLSKTVLEGNKRKYHLEFIYNKDAKMYVCPSGHMAFKKTIHGIKKLKGQETPLYETYFFDVEKCKHCAQAKECNYKGSRTKTYSVTLAMSDIHREHQLKQESEEYQSLAKNRYMIEAKNSELKNQHGYGMLSYDGQKGMTLQAGVSIFVVNLKRILTLTKAK